MKKLSAFFLMILILSQLAVRLGVYVSWKMNQAQLTKTECVNRNVKGSCCYAKCQLEKRMSKVDNSDQPNDSKKSTLIKYSEVEPFVLNSESVSIKQSWSEIVIIPLYKTFNLNISKQYLEKVFHPPNRVMC